MRLKLVHNTILYGGCGLSWFTMHYLRQPNIHHKQTEKYFSNLFLNAFGKGRQVKVHSVFRLRCVVSIGQVCFVRVSSTAVNGVCGRNASFNIFPV